MNVKINYLRLFFGCALLLAGFMHSAQAQVSDTTKPLSVDPALEALFESKIPKEYTIAEVAVAGSKYYDQNLLISIANLKPGDKVAIPGGDNFSKAIIALWKQKLFSDVQIYITKAEAEMIWVEIMVAERPRLSKANFKGIKKSDAEDLTGKIGVAPGQVITDDRKQTAIENIQKFYVEKGYKSVNINLTETPDLTVPNQSFLTFDIERGPKVRINQINILGNQDVMEAKLKKQLKGTKEKSRITLFPEEDASVWGQPKHYGFSDWWKDNGYLYPTKTKELLDPYVRLKLSNAKFNAKKFEEDQEKLLGYYNSLGYRDATWEEDTAYYTPKGNLNIEIKVKEGRRYYFGDITWRGNTKYSDSLLTSLLGIKKGDIYNREKLDKKLGKQANPEGGDISGLYMDDGYLFFASDPVETRVYNDTIDYEIRLREGPQATIKNITIAGNDKTKEHVIRRELRTIPGEKFSRSDLIRTQRELANLGYFNQEKIGMDPVPNQEDGTVDIHYTLEERSSDQLELSAGWGGGIGLTGTLGVTFNNFSIKNILNRETWDPLPSGDGQKLSLRIQSNGRAFRSYNFSFTEPWLGGRKRNSLTTSFFSSRFSNGFDQFGRPVNRASDTSFFKTTGATVALGRQLKWPDDFFTMVTSLTYTRYTLSNYRLFNDFQNGVSNNISLKIALQRSSIDQPLFPRSGSNFLLSGQFTPPYSLFNKNKAQSADPYKFVEFHKWRFTGEWYVPLTKGFGADRSKQLVLKAAVKYGFIGRYNPDLFVSPFERFQVGDAGLTNNFGVLGYDIIAHRGYPVYENSNPNINPDRQSAQNFFTIFNKYQLELRFPFSTNPNSTIYGLTFFEAANGWYDWKSYDPFRLRRSAGVGMRFFLPMFGLLGFDYGIGFDRYTPGASLRDVARFTFMLGFEPE